ncbi:uncharacterized protein LOC127136520 [Lathyrus oleraceus]|uniref:uncharacterized protein LOC127136520 n=1 Tax=Pisum sativum TaxID=3888 RepID=UPI0021D17F84|nr:uncharacterized protein LOC127136520 [Pisum sativum]
MSGLDTDIVGHHLPLREECPTVKKNLRRIRPDMAMKIKEEVQKQFNAAKRLRKYMLTHTTLLISKMYPVKYIFEKPALTGRVACWQMALTEYDIQYVTQKDIKGSVLSNYLEHQPLEDYQSIRFEFPDKDIMLIRDCNIPGPEEGQDPGSRWTLVFDGASNAHGNGHHAYCSHHIPNWFSSPLHEAYIFGIEASVDLRIKILEVYRDSTLVISQVKGDWYTRDNQLIPYKEHVKWKNEAPSFHLNYLDDPAYYLIAEDEADGHPWLFNIMRFLDNQEYPVDASITDKKYLRKLSSNFFLSGEEEMIVGRNDRAIVDALEEMAQANQALQVIQNG